MVERFSDDVARGRVVLSPEIAEKSATIGSIPSPVAKTTAES